MSPEIQKILDDVYAADPSLRAREKEIIAIVEDLLRLRPDTKFDDVFRQRLRAEIMKRAAELGQSTPAKAPAAGWLVWIQRLAFALGGAAICALLILPFAYRQDLWSGVRGLLAGPKSPGAANIEKLKDQAFGPLTLGAASQGTAGTEAKAAVPAPVGETAGYSAPAVTAARDLAVSNEPYLAVGAATAAAGAGVSGSAGSGSAVKTPSSIAVPPIYEGYNYRFAYKGDSLPDLAGTMDVLRRNKNAGAPTLGSLSGLNFNLIDLSKFSGATLQNLNFVTAGDKGYSVSINFTDGSVSINQNWPQGGGIVYAEKAVMRCLSTDCAPQPVKPVDMPADDKIIAVADKFLADFGIARNNYGQPFVQDEWRTVYPMAAEAKTDAVAPDYRYVPEVVSVMYPLQVNGKDVYDESGNKTGMTVSVNVREMEATGVWNLYSQNYQSSAYNTEQDKQLLIDIAEDGGFRQYWYDYSYGRRVRTVELGTPTLAYVKMWIYKDVGGEELLVPSYIFPITKKPDGIYLYQKNVVVPVIKDILDQDNQRPIPAPMPMEGAVQSVETVSPPARVK